MSPSSKMGPFKKFGHLEKWVFSTNLVILENAWVGIFKKFGHPAIHCNYCLFDPLGELWTIEDSTGHRKLLYSWIFFHYSRYIGTVFVNLWKYDNFSHPTNLCSSRHLNYIPSRATVPLKKSTPDVMVGGRKAIKLNNLGSISTILWISVVKMVILRPSINESKAILGSGPYIFWGKIYFYILSSTDPFVKFRASQDFRPLLLFETVYLYLMVFRTYICRISSQ